MVGHNVISDADSCVSDSKVVLRSMKAVRRRPTKYTRADPNSQFTRTKSYNFTRMRIEFDARGVIFRGRRDRLQVELNLTNLPRV